MRYLLLCLVAAAVGCGGSGGGGGNTGAPYTGDWGRASITSVPPPGDTGTMSLTLSGESVTGNLFNSGKAQTAQVTGTLVGNHIDVEVDFPNGFDWTIKGDLDVSGSSITGVAVCNTEEYNRTVHTYLIRVDLAKG